MFSGCDNVDFFGFKEGKVLKEGATFWSTLARRFVMFIFGLTL
jgi:hypothetical protein